MQKTNELRRKEIISILQRLKSEITNILDEKVEMILFGSYARGDFSEYSDVDVLILVEKELNKEENNKLYEIIAEYSLKHDIVISCFIYLRRIFEEYNTPFLLNIKEEGIRI